MSDPLPPDFADTNKPASFYLGLEYDLADRATLQKPIDYESKDLCTHGVVVGMTGSGKTGLSIALLEEAAIDEIPCIVIDPKGDLPNLLLQFDDLAPEKFQPWINPDEAEQKGISAEEFARQLSERWRKGLADTGQTVKRIKQLREKSEFRLYTPGSEAGLPLSILQSFTAPKGNILVEDLNQKIDATAAALLGLTGIATDPLQSREHIFIANLLKHAWTQKPPRDLDLPTLIEQIQEPPIKTVGALELDKFYKEKDRMKLAVALNNILAAPSFSTWLVGDPLDLTTLLAGSKTRQLIFSVAHLDDAQRMFFITLLLAEVVSWTRRQTGSSSLRAILYFDEVFGFLPPHPKNPPTKGPLMTLLKQARAFGVGVLLATQNPVDIDYKALSNAGTWFIGKLQTENDRARLLDGLEGVAAERGARSNRSELEKTIGSLSNRVFLLHNIHRGNEPVVFQSRWALSYLRGPMTREEISRLMEPLKATLPDPVPAPAPRPAASVPPPPAPTQTPQPAVKPTPTVGPAVPDVQESGTAGPTRLAPQPAVKPTPAVTAPTPSEPPLQLSATLPDVPGVTRYFVPVRVAAPAGAQLVYQGFLLGWADVIGIEKKMERKYSLSIRLLMSAPEDGQPALWKKAESMSNGLDSHPPSDARFRDIPLSLNTPQKIEALKKGFVEFLAKHKPTVPACPKLNMTCGEKEDVQTFRARCRVEAWKEFQKKLAAEKETYAAEFARYKAVPPEAPAPAPNTAWEDLWKPYLPDSPVLHCSPAGSLTAREKEQLANLENDWDRELGVIAETWKKVADQLGELPLTLKKGDIKITHFGLAWVPFWLSLDAATLSPAYRV
jgi:hypothetical protein